MAIPARNQRIMESLKRGQQDKIAKLLGVTRQAVNQVLKGEREINDFKLIEAVSVVTGVNMAWLLTGVAGHTDNMESQLNLIEESPLQYKVPSTVVEAMAEAAKNQSAYIKTLEQQVQTLQQELATLKNKAKR